MSDARRQSEMLFGRGSTGGVINQVSKVPALTPFATAAVTNRQALLSFTYKFL